MLKLRYLEAQKLIIELEEWTSSPYLPSPPSVEYTMIPSLEKWEENNTLCQFKESMDMQ